MKRAPRDKKPHRSRVRAKFEGSNLIYSADHSMIHDQKRSGRVQGIKPRRERSHNQPFTRFCSRRSSAPSQERRLQSLLNRAKRSTFSSSAVPVSVPVPVPLQSGCSCSACTARTARALDRPRTSKANTLPCLPLPTLPYP